MLRFSRMPKSVCLSRKRLFRCGSTMMFLIGSGIKAKAIKPELMPCFVYMCKRVQNHQAAQAPLTIAPPGAGHHEKRLQRKCFIVGFGNAGAMSCLHNRSRRRINSGTYGVEHKQRCRMLQSHSSLSASVGAQSCASPSVGGNADIYVA